MRARALMAALGVAAAGSTIIVVPAFANGGSQPSTDNHVEFTNTTATSDNAASFTDVSTAFSTGDVPKGMIQMRWISPKPLPKSQQTNCLVAANDNAAGHIKIGTQYVNSGVLRSTGRYGKFHDTVKAGDKFCKTGVGPSGWQKVKCKNFIWLPFMPKPRGVIYPRARIQLVRNFTFAATVTVSGSVKGTSSSLARCYINGQLGAEATSSASGEAHTNASATAKAKTRQQAIVMARGNAHAVFDSTKLVGVKAQAEQNATVNLHSTASVWCDHFAASETTTPGTPPPHTPPVVQPPPVVTNVTQPQELYPGETYANFCADVSAKKGDKVTVRFGAQFGVGFTVNVTSTGNNRVCGTYTAPTEVPPGDNLHGIPPGYDKVSVVATDTTVNKTSDVHDPNSSVIFQILEAPANPA